MAVEKLDLPTPTQLYDVTIPDFPKPLIPLEKPKLQEFPLPQWYAYNGLRQDIQAALGAAIGNPDYAKLLKVSASQLEGVDLAIACQGVAKAIGVVKAPQVARDVAALLEKSTFTESMGAIRTITPHEYGFVNIALEPMIYGHQVLSQVEAMRNQYGILNIGNGRVMVVDASSPNSAKELTVGHIRPTVRGEVLANLYKAAGYQVIRDNHLGDWGSQFGKLLRAYELWAHEIPELQADPNSVLGLQKLYQKINAAIEDEKHESAAQVSDLEESGRVWFKRLEDGDPEALRLWQWVNDISIKELRTIYDRLGVNFEYILGESAYVGMTQEAVAMLLARGIAHPGETGKSIALDFPAPKDPLDPDKDLPPLLPSCLAIKSDGTTNYLIRDVVTIFARIAWFNPVAILYPVGAEQILHFKQLFETYRRISGDTELKLEHIPLGAVKISGEKMSTRKGNTVSLERLLDRATEIAYGNLLKAFNNGTSALREDELMDVAQQLGRSAAIYMDLKGSSRRGINITDLDAEVSPEGNTATYLQYAHARACSILRQADMRGISIDETVEPLFDTQAQTDIVTLISHYPDAIAQALAQNEPALISDLIFQLATRFNNFYHETKVLPETDMQKRNGYLRLTAAVAQTLRNGLKLLMMDAPERI